MYAIIRITAELRGDFRSRLRHQHVLKGPGAVEANSSLGETDDDPRVM
jgi:hypothetical protein